MFTAAEKRGALDLNQYVQTREGAVSSQLFMIDRWRFL